MRHALYLLDGLGQLGWFAFLLTAIVGLVLGAIWLSQHAPLVLLILLGLVVAYSLGVKEHDPLAGMRDDYPYVKRPRIGIPEEGKD